MISPSHRPRVLAGITEWLGLSFDGPDLPFDELSPSQWALLTAGFTVFSVVASIVAVRWQLTRLPADYFAVERPPRAKRGPAAWIAGNVAGLCVLALGIILLLTPGQGILLILTGLIMLDLKSLRPLERRIVRNRKVLASMNWVRRRAGEPDLLAPPKRTAEVVPPPPPVTDGGRTSEE